MTTEQLLAPRYKVIASYPSMKSEGLDVGTIITCKKYDNDFSEKFWCEMNDQYPHLFRKLVWWEERDLSDMPPYVTVGTSHEQFLRIGEVYKVTEWDPSFVLLVYPNKDFGVPFMRHLFLPATESDYQSYIASKTENK
jgi:hypothetical protein